AAAGFPHVLLGHRYRVTGRIRCGCAGTARSTMLYRSVRPDQAPLVGRIREIAQTRVSYGHRRVHVLLRREGWKVNVKRGYRLSREEGLTLRRKKPKRRRAAQPRLERPAAALPNERLSGDTRGHKRARWAFEMVANGSGGEARCMRTSSVA